jgi:hypothetical protein
MRNYFLFIGIILAIGVVSCKNNKKPTTGNEYNIDNPNTADPNGNSGGLPKIDFAELEYNFGTVIQGEKVSHSFEFTNNGTGNLVISNVKASCGCTVPKWTKEPIKPGKTGTIEIIFDSTNKDGKQTKTANVYSNTQPNVTELIIRCDVKY